MILRPSRAIFHPPIWIDDSDELDEVDRITAVGGYLKRREESMLLVRRRRIARIQRVAVIQIHPELGD